MKALDHGYIEIASPEAENVWGSDENIIRAARMSTDKGFQGWGPVHDKECEILRGISARHHAEYVCICTPKAGDEKLLKYLWDHKHHTPFEMAGLTIEVQAPIMVFREWQRHRTQSYNELSARYTELPDLYYIPSIERLMNGKQAKKNKQGSEEGYDEETAIRLAEEIKMATDRSRAVYNSLLGQGVARELARLVIPVNQYSRMRASASLRNWLAFLTLRMDEGAQFEIREYANALATIIQEKFPRTYSLFSEGR